MKRIVTAALLGAALLVLPASASADVLLTPYLGWNWGGSSGTEADDLKIEYDTRTTYGISVMWLGTSTLGFEADFATIPDFFEPKELDDFDVFGDNGVTTFMGNLVLGSGGGGFKPYLAGGAGLIRQRVASVDEFFDVTENSFGVNVGGGLRVGGRRVSVRGDVRYFRSLQEPEGIFNLDLADFSFWRGTVGVSLGF
jgi:hypothetical protein